MAVTADEVKFGRFKIDGEVTVYAPGSEIGHTMPQVQRHPDGSIYINGCRSGLFKSSDGGMSWTRMRWEFDPNGFGISRDGRIWLIDQTGIKDPSVVVVLQSADGGRTWKKQNWTVGRLRRVGWPIPITPGLPTALTRTLSRGRMAH